MSYPGFTKIIIDYFMSKDPSISKRNKMFWHITRDDHPVYSFGVVSPTWKILRYMVQFFLTELTNQSIDGNQSYQTVTYAFNSREKGSKNQKYIRKERKIDVQTHLPKNEAVHCYEKVSNEILDTSDYDVRTYSWRCWSMVPLVHSSLFITVKIDKSSKDPHVWKKGATYVGNDCSEQSCPSGTLRSSRNDELLVIQN
ncbi:hypothetical protein Tco_0391231 [Tanacetum coccineum]